MLRGADYESLISTVPMKRWGSHEEIAEACVFLCSEKASLISGIELIVDGGKSISV
jgi:NAD(P)-dependent dehydrogenase (short-subunit alcohol dehydrogenase family)